MPRDMPPQHSEAAIKDLKCGSCQWFSTGFKGNNCQKLRDVAVDTIACTEYTKLLPDYLFQVAEDKYIKQIRDSLKGNKYLIADTLLEELKGYIIVLENRPFDYGSNQDIMILVSALQRVISYRGRISVVYTTSLEIKSDLDEMQRYIQLWLNSKYQVFRELKNEQMRSAAVDRLVPELLPLQKSLSKISATSKYLDEQLNNNDWTLRAILSTADKMWYNREYTGGRGSQGGTRGV